MASRRVYPLVSTSWLQNLKMTILKKKTLLNQSSNYSCLMNKISFRPQLDTYQIKSWAKFETENFDGINLIAGLAKGKQSASAASCVFSVYAVSNDATWSETLVTTVPGTQLPDGRFSANVVEATFDPIYLDGETTIKVAVKLQRLGKEYETEFYVNHIGIYGNVFILKKDVKFLELTKLEE